MKKSIANYINKLRNNSKKIDNFCLLQNKRKACPIGEGFCGDKILWPSKDKMIDEIIIDVNLPLSESPNWDYNETDLIENHIIRFTIETLKRNEEVGLVKINRNKRLGEYIPYIGVESANTFDVDINELQFSEYRLYKKLNNNEYRYSKKIYCSMPLINIEENEEMYLKNSEIQIEVNTELNMNEYEIKLIDKINNTIITNIYKENDIWKFNLNQIGNYIILVIGYINNKQITYNISNYKIYVCEESNEIINSVSPEWTQPLTNSENKTFNINKLNLIGNIYCKFCYINKKGKIKEVSDLGIIMENSENKTVSILYFLMGNYAILEYSLSSENIRYISTQKYEIGFIINGTNYTHCNYKDPIDYNYKCNANNEIEFEYIRFSSLYHPSSYIDLNYTITEDEIDPNINGNNINIYGYALKNNLLKFEIKYNNNIYEYNFGIDVEHLYENLSCIPYYSIKNNSIYVFIFPYNNIYNILSDNIKLINNLKEEYNVTGITRHDTYIIIPIREEISLNNDFETFYLKINDKIYYNEPFNLISLNKNNNYEFIEATTDNTLFGDVKYKLLNDIYKKYYVTVYTANNNRLIGKYEKYIKKNNTIEFISLYIRCDGKFNIYLWGINNNDGVEMLYYNEIMIGILTPLDENDYIDYDELENPNYALALDYQMYFTQPRMMNFINNFLIFNDYCNEIMEINIMNITDQSYRKNDFFFTLIPKYYGNYYLINRLRLYNIDVEFTTTEFRSFFNVYTNNDLSDFSNYHLYSPSIIENTNVSYLPNGKMNYIIKAPKFYIPKLVYLLNSNHYIPLKFIGEQNEENQYSSQNYNLLIYETESVPIDVNYKLFICPFDNLKDSRSSPSHNYVNFNLSYNSLSRTISTTNNTIVTINGDYDLCSYLNLPNFDNRNVIKTKIDNEHFSISYSPLNCATSYLYLNYNSILYSLGKINIIENEPNIIYDNCVILGDANINQIINPYPRASDQNWQKEIALQINGLSENYYINKISIVNENGFRELIYFRRDFYADAIQSSINNLFNVERLYLNIYGINRALLTTIYLDFVLAYNPPYSISLNSLYIEYGLQFSKNFYNETEFNNIVCKVNFTNNWQTKSDIITNNLIEKYDNEIYWNTRSSEFFRTKESQELIYNIIYSNTKLNNLCLCRGIINS